MEGRQAEQVTDNEKYLPSSQIGECHATNYEMFQKNLIMTIPCD